MKSYLLLLHLLGIIVWVGGMIFAHFCLRPVAAAQLPPPQRLPLLSAVLGRFFALVAVAVVAILTTGVLMLHVGAQGMMPADLHAMAGIGSLMAVLFAVIYLRLYPALSRAVAAADWPAGAAAMDRIRQLVLINLILGVATVVIGMLGYLAR